jgi:hypothetical protein
VQGIKFLAAEKDSSKKCIHFRKMQLQQTFYYNHACPIQAGMQTLVLSAVLKHKLINFQESFQKRMDRRMQPNHKTQITKIEDGRETVINIIFGITKLALPDNPDPWYHAVVIKGFGGHLMILFTNKEYLSSQKGSLEYLLSLTMQWRMAYLNY